MALCAAFLLAAGCGGGPSGQRPLGVGPDVGVPLRLADCSDWRRADSAQRVGTIDELRAFAGGPVGTAGLHGNVLDDEDAYRVIEGWCRNGFARSFKLYKLYTKAAAFSGSGR